MTFASCCKEVHKSLHLRNLNDMTIAFYLADPTRSVELLKYSQKPAFIVQGGNNHYRSLQLVLIASYDKNK